MLRVFVVWQPLGVEEGAPVLGVRLTRSDSGDYECVATNSAGEDRTQLSLVVEGIQNHSSFSPTHLTYK